MLNKRTAIAIVALCLTTTQALDSGVALAQRGAITHNGGCRDRDDGCNVKISIECGDDDDDCRENHCEGKQEYKHEVREVYKKYRGLNAALNESCANGTAYLQGNATQELVYLAALRDQQLADLNIQTNLDKQGIFVLISQAKAEADENNREIAKESHGCCEVLKELKQLKKEYTKEFAEILRNADQVIDKQANNSADEIQRQYEAAVLVVEQNLARAIAAGDQRCQNIRTIYEFTKLEELYVLEEQLEIQLENNCCKERKHREGCCRHHDDDYYEIQRIDEDEY